MSTADTIAMAGVPAPVAKIIGDFIDAQQADDAELADLAANLTASAAEINVLDGVTAGTVAASKGVVVDADKAVNEWNVFGSLKAGADATDRVTIKGIYMSPANVAVTVPAITDPDIAKVDVNVASAFSMAPAVGDFVFAIPQEAMEANARILGAYVTNTDQITVIFGSEGGNVTGGNKNFKFLVLDLT